ncbi:MAG: MFS transporter, partial [Candidatus Hodarchaeota archaeon]
RLGGNMNIYRNKIGKISSLRIISASLVVFFGSLMAQSFDMRFVFLCQGVLCAIIGIFTVLIRDDVNVERNKKPKKNHFGNFRKNLTEGIRATFHRPVLIRLLVASTLGGMAYQIYNLLTQPMFQSAGAGLLILGGIFSIIGLTNALGYFLGGKIPGKKSEKSACFFIWLFVPVFGVILFLGSAIISLELLIIGTLGYTLLIGLYNPNIEQWYNKIIPDEQRASILSLRSTIRNLAYTATFFISGFLVQLTDLKTPFFIALILSSGVLVFLFLGGRILRTTNGKI